MTFIPRRHSIYGVSFEHIRPKNLAFILLTLNMFFSAWVHLGSHCQQVSSVTNAIDTVRRSLSNYAQSFSYAKKHFTETRKFLLSGLENLKEKANKSSFGMFDYLIHFYLIYFHLRFMRT